MTVGIIGTGFIGRGWAVCFARSGKAVRLWDPVPEAAAAAKGYIDVMLNDLAASDLLGSYSPDEIMSRITVSPTMSQAVDGVVHVQENAPEALDLKRRLFHELDDVVPAGAVIASSTSALLPSAFTEGLAGAARMIVAHPVNPPHLIPLVELVPSPWSSEETVAKTESLLREIGQSPVLLQGEIDGFLLNRLQAAVLDEAFRIVADGYASAEAVDSCMRDGLARRWFFMGPFETIDLNAPGGIRDYVSRYQPMFRSMTDTMRQSADWSGPVLDRIEADRRAQLPDDQLTARQMWRDRQLMALAAFRRDNP
ncbi:3-hydroxyacyl-CoA dehydrogenase [Brucella tritici]|uniref:3-hydroxyacyl-CoA dehydrogenase n=1 Tax=Brucella tritici TaxID=94626 RepID=UPI0020015233|nr:3-hydroxyacyl-CoA dehydrogenase [Brucella tritici]